MPNVEEIKTPVGDDHLATGSPCRLPPGAEAIERQTLVPKTHIPQLEGPTDQLATIFGIPAEARVSLRVVELKFEDSGAISGFGDVETNALGGD